MTTLMVLLAGILFIFLILLSAAHTAHAALSMYELERRKKLGDREAEKILRREALISLTARLRQPLLSVALMLLATLLIVALGWQKGLLLSVVVAFVYERIASMRVIKGW